MDELRDNQMSRGLTQALYKYLPDSWIDFYIKKTRTAYTAKVKNWNSTKLTDINGKRLLEEVSNAIDSFKESGGGVKEFGTEITMDTYDILVPKCGVNSDIIAEIDPMTFFCSNPKCSKVHTFNNTSMFSKSNKKCSNCGSSLKQINFVYACKCGWAGPIQLLPCTNENHKFKNMTNGKNYTFICRTCGISREWRKKCPECGMTLYTKNALDMSIFIPKSLTLIDLVHSEKEKFLSDEKLGSKLVISYWLGKIEKTKFENFVKDGIRNITEEEKSEKINERMEIFIKQGIPAEYAKKAAIIAIEEDYSNKDINESIKFIDSNINILDRQYLNKIAISFLEYDTILNSTNISTLDDAVSIAKTLNTNANPAEFRQIAKKAGIRYTQVSGNVPFVFTSYGYTRKESDPGEGVFLRGFPPEHYSKKNIYANKLVTEGVLFEFDRKRILNWLLKNSFVCKEDLSCDLNNDKELKIWFLNNINVQEIKTFTKIDDTNNKITSCIYTLIHSISHSLIRQAAQLCGLDKNSLSEYIFANVPAVFIYCQNSQGFNLGALFNIFQAYFDKWINSTISEVQKCVFDPICIDRDKACSGCIYLNEVSCQHFNKDLDRRYLNGWFDKITKKRIYGFWEEFNG